MLVPRWRRTAPTAESRAAPIAQGGAPAAGGPTLMLCQGLRARASTRTSLPVRTTCTERGLIHHLRPGNWSLTPVIRRLRDVMSAGLQHEAPAASDRVLPRCRAASSTLFSRRWRSGARRPRPASSRRRPGQQPRGHRALFERAVSFSDQDRALGVDTHAVTNELSAAVYGAVEAYTIDEGATLTPDGADMLGLPRRARWV